MRTREYGTKVKLYFDGVGPIEVGDFMQSHGRKGIGSTYLIEAVSQSPTITRRRYLACLRWPADQIPKGAIVHPIYWYPRTRRRTTLQELERRDES